MNHSALTSDPFKSFIDLVHFDQKLFALQRSLQASQDAIVSIKNKIQAIYDKKKSLEQEWNTLKKVVDAHELEMKIIDEQERTKKKQLDSVSSTKQYQSLTAELELLKNKQHLLEDVIVQAWHAADAAKKQYNEYNVTAQKEIATLEQELHSLHTNVTNSQQEYATQQEARSALLANIPDEWLEKYNAMKDRVSDPVVPVEHGSCDACFHTVSQGDLQQLRRRVLLQCRGCYRFLYLKNLA